MSEEAVVCVNSFAGRREYPCRVVGETPKRYRIMVNNPTPLPPRFSLLLPGQIKLVPKSAVRLLGNKLVVKSTTSQNANPAATGD